MDREIKFRAWDKDAGLMIAAERILHIEFDRGEVKWIGCWYVGRDQDGDAIQQLGQVDKPILMQFTGLKDKNGKEIYEGDVVFVPSTNRRATSVVWQHGGLVTKGNYERREQINAFGSYEVIGNVYENPELLSREGEYGKECPECGGFERNHRANCAAVE